MTNIISNGAYVNYNRYYDMVHTLSRRTSTKAARKLWRSSVKALNTYGPKRPNNLRGTWL